MIMLIMVYLFLTAGEPAVGLTVFVLNIGPTCQFPSNESNYKMCQYLFHAQSCSSILLHISLSLNSINFLFCSQRDRFPAVMEALVLKEERMEELARKIK